MRASVLRRPVSKASTSFVSAPSAVRSSAPRLPASSAASSSASHGRARLRHEVDPAAQSGVGQRGVHRARGQGRRDRQVSQGDPAIGQDDDARPPSAGGELDGPIGQAVQGGSQPGRPRRRIPGGIQPDHPEGPARQGAFHVPHDRAGEVDRSPATGRDPAQQRRARPELDGQVHHGALALGIDRRVRHLGERLAKMVGDRTIHPSESRQRRVVAHAPERLVTLEGHGPDVQAKPLRVQTGEEPDGRGRRGSLWRGGQRAPWLPGSGRPPARADGAAPRSPLRAGDGRPLRRDALPDRAAARVHQQHLPRSEPAAPDDLRSRQRHGARLGGERDESILGHGIRCRPQAVAIHDRSNAAAVRERDRRGPVPRGDEPGNPAHERVEGRIGHGSQGGRIGDRGEQGGFRSPAAGDQRLDRLVERKRVRAVRRGERPTVEDARREPEPSSVATPAADLLAIAPNGIDLAVVGQRAEGLGQAPDRDRVRGVALVEDRVADTERHCQVRIEVGKTAAGDERLVDDPASGCRGHGHLEGCRPGQALDPPGCENQEELEAGCRAAVRPRHDRLGDQRPAGGSLCAQDRRIHRDGPPFRSAEPLCRDGGLDDRPSLCPAAPVARQEQAQDAGPRSESRRDAGQDGGLQRQADPGSVARLAIGGERAAVAQCAEPGECQRQDAVARAPAGIGDEPNPARVMLEPGIVERNLEGTVGPERHRGLPVGGRPALAGQGGGGPARPGAWIGRCRVGRRPPGTREVVGAIRPPPGDGDPWTSLGVPAADVGPGTGPERVRLGCEAPHAASGAGCTSVSAADHRGAGAGRRRS